MTKKIETEWYAYELSCAMWLWLSENPSKGKSDWPEYKFNGINKMRGKCPLCNYYYQIKEFNTCKRCALYPKFCNNTIDTAIYGEWRRDGFVIGKALGTIEELNKVLKLRQIAALQIYEACKAKLLKKRKNNKIGGIKKYL